MVGADQGAPRLADQTPALPALAELPQLLLRAASGVEFIYRALELVAAHYGLHDAVAVIDSTGAGRQVFRLDRKHFRAGVPDEVQAWLRTVSTGAPGLYTDPPIVDPVVGNYVVSVVELALRQDLLHHDSRHDVLTGLLNRRSYELVLRDAVARTRRYGWPFVLVLLDMDDFKSVNDRLGHAAGDAALRTVGTEIRACLRAGDVAARLGGDEFVLLLLNADTTSVLGSLNRRLRDALDRALPDAGVTFSTGAATFPEDAEDSDALLQVADRRLYGEKSSSR
ncbi:MAG: GGDEF domain-containing protein [Actinomycetota bacterium]|nr:GGDEF domain-containing protein [Actinomycetota bacterium]